MRGRQTLVSLPLLTAALIAAFAAPAGATDRFASPNLNAAVTSPTLVVTPETRQVVAHVELKAGAHRVAVGIEAASPAFSRLEPAYRLQEGPTLRPLRIQPTRPFSRYVYTGSGSERYPSCWTQVADRRSGHGGDFAGTITSGIELKAHESLGLDITYDIAADMPWFGTSYAPIVRLLPVSKYFYRAGMISKGARRLKHRVSLRPPAPFVTGPFAARLDLTAIDRPDKAGPVIATGRLVPAAAGKTVILRAQRMSGRVSYPAFSADAAVTAADGSFQFNSWRPKLGRDYAIALSYPEQPGELLADTMCASVFPVPVPPPPPE